MMNESLEKYKNYLLGLLPILLENAKQTRSEAPDAYTKGKLFAYYDILTVMQQQAEAFGIDTEELGISNIKDADFFPATK